MKKPKTARKRRFSSYSKRNRILRKMGFPTYGDYLKSDLWKQIREKVFRIKGQWCRMCNTTATQLHHQRYSRSDLNGSRIKHIFPVCAHCHKFVEFAEDGSKLDLIEVRRVFNKSRRGHSKRIANQKQANSILRASYEAVDIDSAAQRWGL